MNKMAADLKIGDVVRVSYVDRNSKDLSARLVVRFDENGFESTVTNVRDRALVGRGMLVQLSQGAFRKVMPDDIATLA